MTVEVVVRVGSKEFQALSSARLSDSNTGLECLGIPGMFMVTSLALEARNTRQPVYASCVLRRV
jgi:hypothetical protein